MGAANLVGSLKVYNRNGRWTYAFSGNLTDRRSIRSASRLRSNASDRQQAGVHGRVQK